MVCQINTKVSHIISYILSSESSLIESTNKSTFEIDDPNRPRFTTLELKDILQERNDLKAKISDLEDELDLYRPKKTSTM